MSLMLVNMLIFRNLRFGFGWLAFFGMKYAAINVLGKGHGCRPNPK